MLTLSKPTQDDVSSFLARQVVADFSYRELECTRGTAPVGWYDDRYRAHLGKGVETFARAREAVLTWAMFRLGWVEAHPAASAVTPGANVAVLVRACGAWWLNGARIVYVHDSPTDDRQFGFAYGTLQDHAECGEERFWVVRDHDDQVWFELTAMSHPAKWFVRAGLPLVRRLQRRFAANAQRAMQTAVGRA